MCHSVTLTQAGADLETVPETRGHRPVPRLAEIVDAVVGVDTHRDTHAAEIALPTGTPLAACTISNDSSGYAELIDWIARHTPGPLLVVAIEGTRSYGVGLARAAMAAGLLVIESAQPARAAAAGRASPTRSTHIWRC